MTRRVVLAGNNLAAAYTLDLLLDALTPAEILVIAPTESKLHSWQVSLAEHGRTRGVPVIEPVNVNDADVVDQVHAHGADLLLSVYYTQIFSPALLGAVDGAALNVHPSLLPRHRGTAPVVWAIVEGDRTTGISVHHIDAGIDTGNLVLQRPLPIHPEDTGYELHLKFAKLVRAGCAELLRSYFAGDPIPPGVPQSGQASHHSTRDPTLNHIDWSGPRERIANIVRALAPPLPGAYGVLDREKIVLVRVDPVEIAGGHTPKPPGMLEMGPEGSPLVWAGDGALRLTSIERGGSIGTGDEAFAGESLAGRFLA